MGIADRIILTLYTILMTVASVLTLLCSLGVFSDTGMVAFISHIPGNWVYAVGSLVGPAMFLFGIYIPVESTRAHGWLMVCGLVLWTASNIKLHRGDES